ncbi:MAG: hypothetical protein PHC98_01775, partial [Syntrophotalea acetylenica]|nr:hypothetical protein [Syntrophotalea acetylenica]
MLRHAAAREHPFKCATPVVKLKTIFRKIDDRFCDVKFKIDNRFHLLRRHKYIYQNNEINTFKIGDTKSVAKAIIKTFENKKFENKNGKKLL